MLLLLVGASAGASVVPLGDSEGCCVVASGVDAVSGNEVLAAKPPEARWPSSVPANPLLS